MSTSRFSAGAIALVFAFATASTAFAQLEGQGSQESAVGDDSGSGGSSLEQLGQGDQQSLEEKPLTRDETHRLIRTYGYSNIKDLKKEGDKFVAVAKKDGKKKRVVVDPKQGSVREAGS